MARIPMGNFGNAIASAPPRVNVPSGAFDSGGRQLQALGETGMEIADQIKKEADAKQKEADTLSVIEATNHAKEKMFDLLYHPESGALNQRGDAAIKRDSGTDLATEYSGRFKDVSEGISSSLPNEQQRKMFKQQSDSMRLQIYGSAQQHLSGEFQKYKVSVLDATVASSQREISLMGGSGQIPNDPETGTSMLDLLSEKITVATKEKARLMGLPQDMAEVETRKALSNAHVLAIDSALEARKPEYADLYLKKYAGQMDANDILRVKGKLDGEVNAQIGATVAGDVLRSMQPRIQPNDTERAFNIAVGTESGGKQFGADGAPLTSPKGAIGIAQVMPGTAPEAAKLAGLPFDETRYKTDAGYNKALGLAYFQKQLQDNGGDLAKAYAAYNAGPGALQAAMKKAEKSSALNKNDPTVQTHEWLDFMPTETKDYVAKNMKAFETGQGQPPRPTFAEIDEALRADPRLAANPARYKVARDEASRQFDETTKAIKQRDEDAVSKAMTGIIQNGGRFGDLPASVRGALPPKEVDGLMTFAQKIAKGEDSTSLWLYNKLSSNPDQLARMSDNEFFALRRELSESDFKHFSTERAKLNGITIGTNGAGNLNSTAIKQTLDDRLRMLQIDPTPKDDGSSEAARVGGIRRFVDQYFLSAQRETGKKFTDAEVAQHVDALFAKNATFRGWFSNTSGPLLSMKPGDIPSSDRDGIKAAFTRQGIDAPTDAQLLNAYWNMKVARK